MNKKIIMHFIMPHLWKFLCYCIFILYPTVHTEKWNVCEFSIPRYLIGQNYMVSHFQLHSNAMLFLIFIKSSIFVFFNFNYCFPIREKHDSCNKKIFIDICIEEVQQLESGQWAHLNVSSRKKVNFGFKKNEKCQK